MVSAGMRGLLLSSTWERRWEAQSYVFFDVLRRWEAQLYVFYDVLRRLEAHKYVFYNDLRHWEGPVSNHVLATCSPRECSGWVSLERTSRVWEAQQYVFYDVLRRWEAQMYVFYDVLRRLGVLRG